MTIQDHDRESVLLADAVLIAVSRLFNLEAKSEAVKAVFERFQPNRFGGTTNPENLLSERFEHLASLARSVGR